MMFLFAVQFWFWMQITSKWLLSQHTYRETPTGAIVLIFELWQVIEVKNYVGKCLKYLGAQIVIISRQ